MVSWSGLGTRLLVFVILTEGGSSHNVVYIRIITNVFKPFRLLILANDWMHIFTYKPWCTLHTSLLQGGAANSRGSASEFCTGHSVWDSAVCVAISQLQSFIRTSTPEWILSAEAILWVFRFWLFGIPRVHIRWDTRLLDSQWNFLKCCCTESKAFEWPL